MAATAVSFGVIDETASLREEAPKLQGFRTELINCYDIPKLLYQTTRKRSAAYRLGEIGALLYYAIEVCHRMGRKKRITMEVDKLVETWRVAVVGLAVAHDKDEADRYEASIDSCLTPLLAAPIKQVREFADKLLVVLKNDPKVPFLVWRAYEVWLNMIKKAPDEGVKELKTQIAREIADIV